MNLNLVKLNKELSEIELKNKQFEVKLHESEDKVKELEAKIKELEEMCSKYKADAEDEKKKKEETVEATVKSVNKQVIQKLSTIGIPQGTIKEEVVLTPQMNSNDIFKQFETIENSSEKIKFYNDNKKAILEVMDSLRRESPVLKQIAHQRQNYPVSRQTTINSQTIKH